MSSSNGPGNAEPRQQEDISTTIFVVETSDDMQVGDRIVPFASANCLLGIPNHVPVLRSGYWGISGVRAVFARVPVGRINNFQRIE